jgi:competence protein ComEC
MLLACALATGIAWDRYAPLAAWVWWALAISAAIAWGICWRAGWNRTSSTLLLAVFVCIGGGKHHAHWRLYESNDIGRYVDEILRPAVIESVAITSPRWVPAPPPTPLRTIPQGEHCELLVRVTAIRDGRTMRPANGLADLQVSGNLTGVRAGDRLRIMVQAARPAPPLNPGEFDFAAHLRSDRKLCRMFAEFPESVERLSPGSPLSPRRWLADIRASGAEALRQNIAHRRATLASAVLLGAREQLDADRNEGYLVTGTIHVLSISGLHVGILAAAFFGLFRTGLMPRRMMLAATTLLTIAYACLTDLQPPVVRATILVVAACLALWLQRPALGFNTLAAAAIAVLIYNPASLFQAGPQLSFLAVATLIACQPVLLPQPITDPLDRLIATTRPWPVRVTRGLRDWIWRVWLTGALIWLISTPLVWKQYNLVSFSALLVNFLMWLPVTFAMWSGMLTLAAAPVSSLLARLAGMTCDGSLQLVEGLIDWGRGLPGAYTWWPAPPGWWIAAFYVSLGAAAAFPALRPRRHWVIALATAWIAGAVLLSGSGLQSIARSDPRPLACSFVAVGHGVSVLIELPDGRNMLYDAGRLGSPLAGVRPASAVLWSRGISHLDAVIVSHADADHFNALPDLLDRFSVGVVYVSPVMFEEQPPAVRELREAIDRHGVKIEEVSFGDRLLKGAVVITVLHPPRRGVLGSDNANSIVLLLEYAGRRVLLTGDLESPGLDDVLAEEPLDCDVVLAPHHGSPRSSPSRFSEWSTPETVVVSGGRSLGDLSTIAAVRNSFRLAGAEVYHTSDDGCVRVEIAPENLTVHSFRPHVRGHAADIAGAKLLQAE